MWRKWVKLYCSFENDDGCQMPFKNFYNCADIVIMQFFGKKDINGNKLFEGDVFTVNGKYPKYIEYDQERSGFCVINIADIKDKSWRDIKQFPAQNWWDDFKREIEIMGNIYENPELLKI